MILKIGDEPEHQIWHLHFHTAGEETDEERAERGLPPLLWDITTTCLVHTGPCIFSTPDSKGRKHCINGRVGVAHCSKKDQYVRAVSNKLALQRALGANSKTGTAEVPKATRLLVWQAYNSKVRYPKEKSAAFQRRLKLTQSSKAA